MDDFIYIYIYIYIWINVLHFCALLLPKELLIEKEQGTARVHQLFEMGEKLYPNTAIEGREIIRQQLRFVCDANRG